jgi:hypothetical protein
MRISIPQYSSGIASWGPLPRFVHHLYPLTVIRYRFERMATCKASTVTPLCFTTHTVIPNGAKGRFGLMA